MSPVLVLFALLSAADPIKPTATAGAELTSFPAVDLGGLDASQKALFARIANDEMCPCGCPKSFGACLQSGTQCGPAVLLAEWLVDAIKDGISPDSLQQAMTKELTGGFAATPKSPDVKGFASKGSQRPAVTIVEYADFECAHCRAASPVVDELVKKHPEVRVVFKHYPLPFHAMARSAAIAAEAAGRQNKFWEMHDAIFATQDLLSDELILGHAKALGLDVKRFKKDLLDPEIAKKVDGSKAEGTTLGVDATPAFVINGRPYYLSRSVDGFELRLKMEDARSTASCQ
jgi:protein-disulfide isomerase